MHRPNSSQEKDTISKRSFHNTMHLVLELNRRDHTLLKKAAARSALRLRDPTRGRRHEWGRKGPASAAGGTAMSPHLPGGLLSACQAACGTFSPQQQGPVLQARR